LSTIGIRKIGKNIFRVRGDVNIRDMNRTLDLNLNEKNSSTVAGFLIYETETFPDVGQTFTFNNILFEILNKKNNQITQLKITLPEKNKITH
jgi:Mg2+/Co2+ transporter CorB